jgi:hypothetical protein
MKSCFWHGYGKKWDPIRKAVVYANRWAWEQKHGKIPNGMMVLHHCDNPPCINVDHLYLGTQKDNMRDRKERGRNPDVRGVKNPNCKISEKIVDRIRALNGKMRQADIAKKFGVSQGYVSKVLRYVNRG